MKHNFEQSLKNVLADEGKFSNIPADRGGPTNQGITLKTLINYHAHFAYGDLDRDGDVDIDDVRLLDEPEEAAPIYRAWFWDAVRADDLPAGVDYLTFDSAVNHGPENAAIFLQRAVNRMGYGLAVDGSIGPKTIAGAQWCDRETLITDILRERQIFYQKIVARDLSQEIFFRGWMNRLAKVAANLEAIR